MATHQPHMSRKKSLVPKSYDEERDDFIENELRAHQDPLHIVPEPEESEA